METGIFEIYYTFLSIKEILQSLIILPLIYLMVFASQVSLVIDRMLLWIFFLLMTIASLVILTSSPHIWNSDEIATGVSKEKWEEMIKFGVGFESEDTNEANEEIDIPGT